MKQDNLFYEFRQNGSMKLSLKKQHRKRRRGRKYIELLMKFVTGNSSKTSVLNEVKANILFKTQKQNTVNRIILALSVFFHISLILFSYFVIYFFILFKVSIFILR